MYIHTCVYIYIYIHTHTLRGLPRLLSGKEPLANAGVTGDVGSIPELEDPLEKEMATHSSNLVREISWTEDPGGLQSVGL